MKTITLLLLLSFTSQAQMTSNGYKAKDGELKHNLAGQAIGMVSGWVAYKKTNKIWVGMLTCFASAIIIGIAKEEIYDRNFKMGTPSDKDKLATGWGGMVGAICLVPIMKCHSDKIYEAEQMCSDLKNPIFLRDSI